MIGSPVKCSRCGALFESCVRGDVQCPSCAGEEQDYYAALHEELMRRCCYQWENGDQCPCRAEFQIHEMSDSKPQHETYTLSCSAHLLDMLYVGEPSPEPSRLHKMNDIDYDVRFVVQRLKPQKGN